MKWLSLFLLFSSSVFAGESPLILSFKEGESIALNLSKTNLNRIVVPNEKITQIRFPAGMFHVDGSDSSEVESSVYLKPVRDEEITVFLTTNKNRHLSLKIKGEEGAGKTIALQFCVPPVLSKKSPKGDLNPESSFFKKLIRNELSPDTKTLAVDSKSFYIKGLKLNLEKAYQTNQLKGYIYRLENNSSQLVYIDPKWFKSKGVKSIHVNQLKLGPKSTTYMYTLTPAQEAA